TLFALNEASSLFDPSPLRDLIATSLDFDRIRASSVRLLVTATDLAAREKRVFDNRTVTVDALMAAAAVPGLFPPVEVDGTLLVDGGLTGRAPVLEALEADASVGRAVVVMSYAPTERGASPSTMRRALEESFELMMIQQIRRNRSGGGSEGGRSPPPRFLGYQPVELARVLARHLVSQLRGQMAELLVDVLGRLRPHAVPVRIVRAPHQRLHAHVVDQLGADA